MTATVRTRRIYDDPQGGDGRRVLVDRVWPRGLRKDADRFDEWLREVAPSTELRRWYGHRPERFAEFRKRYEGELSAPERQEALGHLRDLAQARPVTLLTATRDLEHSHAAVLAGVLGEGEGGGG
ncbi:DUF488 family protein [Dactylosporangium sp. NPDC005572]|uniref:DUF488 domain-containing protein n=1 Tax=Dactylosporangium sp. NPDC005572 TaxID=3156889 RepID=UPI0033A3C774